MYINTAEDVSVDKWTRASLVILLLLQLLLMMLLLLLIVNVVWDDYC